MSFLDKLVKFFMFSGFFFKKKLTHKIICGEREREREKDRGKEGDRSVRHDVSDGRSWLHVFVCEYSAKMGFNVKGR